MGLPTWSGPAVVFASLITGLLLSLLLGDIGLPYQLLFIIGSLGVALLVEARGLFLTVASMPILFGIFTPLTAWFVSQQGIAGGQGVSATAILTAIYPLAEMFPALILVTLVSALIGVARIMLLRRNQQHLQTSGEQARRARREEDRANTTVASRARAQSTRARPSSRRMQDRPGSQVTVDELIRRSQERRQQVARHSDFAPTPGPQVAPPPQPQQPGPVEPRQARPPKPRRRKSLDDDLYS